LRSLFITGTDTGSGKTFVTAGIVRELRRSGIDAVPAKPVQTGCVNGFMEDLEYCLEASGMDLSPGEKRNLCPLVYPHPCSPHLAAELAGEGIDTIALAEKMKGLGEVYPCVVAEGAGGVMVPLERGLTMLDLMSILGWPVVLVVSDRLGAINHTLLSITALRRAGLEPAGVVINHLSPPSGYISRGNRTAIEDYGNIRILGEVPCSPGVLPEVAFREIVEGLKRITG
jgi:dethiobiotin synthase